MENWRKELADQRGHEGRMSGRHYRACGHGTSRRPAPHNWCDDCCASHIRDQDHGPLPAWMERLTPTELRSAQAKNLADAVRKMNPS